MSVKPNGSLGDMLIFLHMLRLIKELCTHLLRKVNCFYSTLN